MSPVVPKGKMGNMYDKRGGPWRYFRESGWCIRLPQVIADPRRWIDGKDGEDSKVFPVVAVPRCIGFGERPGPRAIEELMKTVFTTGEAAEICKVSQQTIIRCFDSGRLKGFRVPGSRFRRIPREALIQFMKDNGIPPDALDNRKTKVLVVDDDPEIVELFVDVLERDGRFEVKTASTGYDAGMNTDEVNPDPVILDHI